VRHRATARVRLRAFATGQGRDDGGGKTQGHIAGGRQCEPLQRLAADSDYWSIANVSAIPDAPTLLIPPAGHDRHGKPRKDGKPTMSESDSVRAAMRAKLDGPGTAYYARRSRTIEPVFGQIKTVQGGRRFMRRGLTACALKAPVRRPGKPIILGRR
jgi:hypothetical protein